MVKPHSLWFLALDTTQMCVVLSAEAAVVVSPCQHLKYHHHCRAACRLKPEEPLSASMSEMNTNQVGILLINLRQVKIFMPFFSLTKGEWVQKVKPRKDLNNLHALIRLIKKDEERRYNYKTSILRFSGIETTPGNI